MISLLSVTEQGQAVEVGFTGFEGLVGLPLLLGRNEIPYQALTQAPTDALRIESKFAVQLFNKCGAFHKIVLQYFHVVLKQLSQTCLCNHFHRIEARLCRWLTVMSERSGNTHLVLTQEFLAHMLGVQRTSIGMIAASMQSAGIIRYSRGKVEIVNFERLKNSACECYRIVKEEHQKFIGSQNNFYMSDNRQTDEAVSFIM
jgi:CRP-like cAMP-binding protein